MFDIPLTRHSSRHCSPGSIYVVPSRPPASTTTSLSSTLTIVRPSVVVSPLGALWVAWGQVVRPACGRARADLHLRQPMLNPSPPLPALHTCVSCLEVVGTVLQAVIPTPAPVYLQGWAVRRHTTNAAGLARVQPQRCEDRKKERYMYRVFGHPSATPGATSLRIRATTTCRLAACSLELSGPPDCPFSYS